MSRSIDVDVIGSAQPEILIRAEPNPGPTNNWLKLSIYAWEARYDLNTLPRGKTSLLLRLPILHVALNALPPGAARLNVEGQAKSFDVSHGFYTPPGSSAVEVVDGTSLFRRKVGAEQWYKARDWQLTGLVDSSVGALAQGAVSTWALTSEQAQVVGVYSLQTFGVGAGVSAKTKIPAFRKGPIKIRQRDWKSLFAALDLPVSAGMPGAGDPIRCLRPFSLDDLNGTVGSVVSGSVGLGLSYSATRVSATGLFLDHASNGVSVGGGFQVSAGIGVWARLLGAGFESDIDGGLPFGATYLQKGGPVLRGR